MAVLRFTVPEEWAGQKLNDFLRKEHHLSGTTIKRARHTEMGLTMNGCHIRTIDPIESGAVIEVITDAVSREYKPCNISVDILYIDEDIAVLDKPAGIPCHPSRGHPYDTLANAFANINSLSGRVFRPVGRLDKDTSGAVICALHPHSAFALEGEGRPKKRYLAIVSPPPEKSIFMINAPIERQAPDSIIRCVRPDGKSAVTNGEVLLSDETAALVSLKLETGRTHQIRVHMAHIGSPLIGDPQYGGKSGIGRAALHCERVRFTNPMSRKVITAASPLPDDMREFLLQRFSDKEISAAIDEVIL